MPQRWSGISLCDTTSWAKMLWSATRHRGDRKNAAVGAAGYGSRRCRFSTNQIPRHIREDRKPVASRLASDEELGSLFDVLGEMNSGVVQLSGGGADARGRIAYAARHGAPHRTPGVVAKHQP